MVGMYLTQPTHLAVADGAWTACGLRGIQHRNIRYTRDASRVSCRSCRRWMKKQEVPID